MSDSRRGVLVLAGATASGKTELAIELARTFDAEIVGADSRQIYRGMPIGTATPVDEQLRAVPHHCVGFLEPHERYSAARYVADAMAAVDDIHARGKRAIVAGGTGFYVRALTGNVALAAQFDETLRARLAAEARQHPPEFLHAWLMLRDPLRAATLDVRDTYRVVRALEVALSRGSVERAPLRTLASAGIEWTTAFLDVPVAEIDKRIAARCERMLQAGLLEEAERIGERAVAATAVGYPQALGYLRGWCTRDELRASLARVTRRYARRQRAWFCRERDALWVEPSAVERLVREKLSWS